MPGGSHPQGSNPSPPETPEWNTLAEVSPRKRKRNTYEDGPGLMYRLVLIIYSFKYNIFERFGKFKAESSLVSICFARKLFRSRLNITSKTVAPNLNSQL